MLWQMLRTILPPSSHLLRVYVIYHFLHFRLVHDVFLLSLLLKYAWKSCKVASVDLNKLIERFELPSQ